MTSPGARPLDSPRQPRIFLEASFTFGSGLGTGIQRVVRKIVGPLVEGTAPLPAGLEAEVIPVRMREEAIYRLDLADLQPPPPASPPPASRRLAAAGAGLVRGAVKKALPFAAVRDFMDAPRWRPGFSYWVARLARLPFPRQAAPPIDDRRLRAGTDFGPGDVCVFLDSSWHLDYWPAVRALQQAGVRCVFVIYDLIPLLEPGVVLPYLRQVFVAWLEDTVRAADGYLAISRAVADDVRAYLARHPPLPGGREPARLPVRSFPLGAELRPRSATPAALGPELERADLAPGSFFLMVGTLEPRKRQLMVVEAFERLWRAGSPARLALVGGWGWLEPGERARLERHPELGRRLFHFTGVSDPELDTLYGRARAVIQASRSEGFGLPIVEAAFHRKQVICTDIPVFREVAPAGTRFFARDSVAELAEAIASVAQRPPVDTPPAAVQLTTWDQSREHLLRAALVLAGRGAR